MTAFAIHEACWQRDTGRLSAIRRTVFIEEQGVPEALEWDEHDASALHWLAVLADGTAIGCARLLPDGQLGRMAVLPAWRGSGVGRGLLAASIRAARVAGHASLRLSAQIHAVGFYAAAGFISEGETYEEAGIPHVAMRLILADREAG